MSELLSSALMIGEQRNLNPSAKINDAISRRNEEWVNNPQIPVWVDVDNVELDRFFTRPEIAESCWRSFVETMAQDHANEQDYKFIEPSAGYGSFYDLLPKDRRVGIDIVPGRPEFEVADFLSWNVQPNGRRYAVIGNPPFGYRAWLALAFLNHAARFADYIGFILPMGFQSDGKGSAKFRVVGAELVLSESLPSDSFILENGQTAKVNALWQIWRRGVNNQRPKASCDSWIDLFTVDMRKERLCGQERLTEADRFLQRTFYNDPPTLVRNFSDVRYVCGYGIVIHRKKQEIMNLLNQTDWRNYSNLATHNCRHISMYHIRKVLTDNGFVDG